MHFFIFKPLYFADGIVTIGRESSLTDIQVHKYGVIDIKSDPEGAKIYIDGENTGDRTPMFYAKADAKYLVTLRYDNYRDTTFQTEILNARDVELEVNLKPFFITVYSGKV
ncbi:MAG: PEGA domain-containing protein, partial [Ignavibacteriae bacterium]|nr:PEGA domain-containing protein [Ignavibacteriota bacterium]